MESLKKFHPKESFPTINELPRFTKVPPMGIVTVTEETVCRISSEIRGEEVPGGTEAY